MINLGWFRGNDDKSATEQDEGVVSVIDSMEGFKKSQKIGKFTGSLVSELASTTVEGFSPDGKVKVILDGQQRPMSVEIDEAYFDSTNVLDFSNAITAAMQEAHQKSRDKMNEKMKGFFSDLGIQKKD